MDMQCVPITLSDGSVVLVAVKPGETLTEEDMETLREVFEHKRKVAQNGRET